MTEWRKLDKRRTFPKDPKEKEFVLVYTDCDYMPIKVSSWSKLYVDEENNIFDKTFGISWRNGDYWDDDLKVFYWAPLPEPPEGKTK